MFPNQFAIYLHDTPTRELFDRAERAFSNGCVRVENPLALAHLLLAGQVDDPVAAFDGWLAAKAERHVTLDRPIPVHLVYRTVFLDDAGAVQHRFDVYGRDAKVWRALADEGVRLPAAQG
jgi:murein L,D-transpeptidase YcbB/YkuD